MIDGELVVTRTMGVMPFNSAARTISSQVRGSSRPCSLFQHDKVPFKVGQHLHQSGVGVAHEAAVYRFSSFELGFGFVSLQNELLLQGESSHPFRSVSIRYSRPQTEVR